MAKQETLEEFFKNWHKFDEKIVRQAVAGWNSNTLLAMSKAQFYSPVRTGQLQGSARRVRAKITKNGIESSYIFGVPYAIDFERGFKIVGGKKVELTPRTAINPNAQIGFASKGADEQENEFMADLNRAISKAFNQI
jgi:hypothetical protein